MARIIIADDDEIVGEVACDALIAAGHGAGLLANGTDALNVIKNRKPDLVILDCNMPGLNGLLVLREMRNSIALNHIPVLVLTGRRGNSDEELARFEGADDYMRKPFDPDELVFRVEQMLAKHNRKPAH
ncbi:response regulator transcription factor [Sphingomonas sp. PAMC 26617]|uniref:response regulator transcription factor n=1 Tax=Sphingomonas sp. PAMC 26617 TaxID=1112216 RepID=UPI0012F4F204|nr:response regulator [Sphingomonas sp. PAMC 26617]